MAPSRREVVEAGPQGGAGHAEKLGQIVLGEVGFGAALCQFQKAPADARANSERQRFGKKVDSVGEIDAAQPVERPQVLRLLRQQRLDRAGGQMQEAAFDSSHETHHPGRFRKLRVISDPETRLRPVDDHWLASHQRECDFETA